MGHVSFLSNLVFFRTALDPQKVKIRAAGLRSVAAKSKISRLILDRAQKCGRGAQNGVKISQPDLTNVFKIRQPGGKISCPILGPGGFLGSPDGGPKWAVCVRVHRVCACAWC